MKKIVIIAVWILATCGFASAQSPRAVLDKVKEIKLLESTRNDVRRILVNYESNDPDYEEYSDEFSNDIADIEVSYSSGKCEADDEENYYNDIAEIWKVDEWRATKIVLAFDDEITAADIESDLSQFTKYKVYPDDEDSSYFIYHSKNSGIALVVEEDQVEKIIIYPAKSSYSALCDNEKARKFSSTEEWFGTNELLREHADPLANVTDLILSAKEIIVDNSDKAKNKNRSGQVTKISVKTIAVDPENDVLTYNYEVSGGKIIGQGANVIWDLSGVPPGTYTITAGVDDGCGICGQTKTDTVVVKTSPKK